MIVILVVIFVPMLIEDEGMQVTDPVSMEIPPWPEPQEPSFQPDTDGASNKLPIPDLVEQPEPPPPPATVATVAKVQPKQKAPAPAERKKHSAWVVQAGSFSSKKNAGQLVKKMQKKGLPAYYEKAVVDGKTRYRVRIGPDLERKTAEKFIAQIKRDFKLNGKLKAYP